MTSSAFGKAFEITVLYGGISRERDISLRTGQACIRALQNLGHRVVALDWAPDRALDLKAMHTDLVLIALHGGDGEGGQVQALLDLWNIPYTGSGMWTSALAMDKAKAKQWVKAHGFPTPAWALWSKSMARGALEHPKSIDLPINIPLVLKPNQEGSSVGVHLIREFSHIPQALSDCIQRQGDVLWEALIVGPEVSVGLLDGKALGICEIRTTSDFYDYEAKYLRHDTQYLIPTSLGSEADLRIMHMAEEIYRIMDARGVARVDFMVKDRKQPMFLELNTIPGLTETSLVPKMARARGMTFEDLVQAMVLSALGK